jgi:hypothetical protein
MQGNKKYLARRLTASKICNMQKQIFDLPKEVKDSKALQGKVNWLKADITRLVEEKNFYF